MVRLLVREGASINQVISSHSPLSLAILYGHDQVGRSRRENGEREVGREGMSQKEPDEMVRRQELLALVSQVVDYLLTVGADPNLTLGALVSNALCATTTHTSHRNREFAASVKLVRWVGESGRFTSRG